MKKIFSTLLLATVTTMPAPALTQYSADLAGFSAERGKALWTRKHTVSGQQRSCASCHTANPRLAGKHIRTGKAIKPMASSINSSRFTDPKKSAKWFRRNCKWTLGRECSEQEKRDITQYLKTI